MRLIPGKIKVKIELFKGITATDGAIALVAIGLLALALTSSLPGKVFVCGGVVMVAGALLARLDGEPNYLFILHMLCFLVSRKRFKRKEVDKDFFVLNPEEGAEEEPEAEEQPEAEETEPKETEKERKARLKKEEEILKSKTASQEEKDEILEKRRIASIEAARKIAEKKDATVHRASMSHITAVTDIKDGYLEYGGHYFGAAIEIPPVEFRFFSASRRANAIENGVGRILRSLPAEYFANLVKIERPALYDNYLELEYSKLDELRTAYEKGLLREDEMKARVEIIYDRITDLQNLCYGDKVIETYFYLVLFDSDKRQLDIMISTALDTLRNGEMSPRRLNSKELAVFLKYTNQIDFDERDIDRVAPENYVKWAMPQVVDMKMRTVEVNHILTYNMKMVSYPTVVSDAWMAGVASMPGTKVVMKFRPMDRTKALKGIDRSLQELRGQWAATQIDSKRVELEDHINTLSTLLSMLQSDNEALLETNIYVTSYDIAATRARTTAVQPPKSSLPNITNMKKSVRRLYQESNFRLSDMDFNQISAYIGSQVSGYDPMQEDCRGIPSNTLAASFPWIFAKVADQNGVKIGVSDGVPVFVDFFRRDSERVNSNMVIVGKSGSGKSYATKSLLANLAADGAKIFILDPENEYTELATNLHGKFINVGNAQYGRLNPFHIISALDDDESGENTTGSYATHLQFLEEFFRQLLPDCDKDAMEYLNSLVNRMYFRKGISEETDLSKLRPEDYPVFDDLYDSILNEFQSTDNEYIHTMLRTLMNYIAKFSQGGRNANIWNGPSTITTEENFSVFNFQSLLSNRNSTIANSQMLLVLKYIDNEIIKNRDYNTKYHTNRKVVVVIDEAHVFIDTKFPVALDFMFQLAKRIRKYNGMQIVITQNIKDFVGSEEIARKSTAIINACQYSFIFALSPNDMDDLCKLYEKAGGINENEQDQIVRASRGTAFTVLSPQSRSSFRIVVPQEVAEMFSEQHYVSHYFEGEEGAANWEDFIGDSREKHAIMAAITATLEEEEAEQERRSSVIFRELGDGESLFGEEEPESEPEPEEEPFGGAALSWREEEDLPDMTALSWREESRSDKSASGVKVFNQQGGAAAVIPGGGMGAAQVIVQNDNSRMEAMLGELLNKLTRNSMLSEMRQSIREEIVRELAAAGVTADALRQPIAAAQFVQQTPIVAEQPVEEQPEAAQTFMEEEAELEEEAPESGDEEQWEESFWEDQELPEDTESEDEDMDTSSVSRILEEYLQARESEKPSVIELMRRYHDTVSDITLEELAYHNMRQEAAG